MRQKFLKIRDKIILSIKSFFYQTLTEENIDKIIKRKEQEIEDLEILEKQNLSQLKEELRDELCDYNTDEEIDEIFNEIVEKHNEAHEH